MYKTKKQIMSSTRVQFINGGDYHLVNRAIEGQMLFREIADYFRFMFCLYELNDKNLVKMRDRIKKRKARKYTGQTSVSRVSREPLVEILATCLMPNHYHLIIRQLVNNGISEFMRKLGNGYVGYFNEKYHRNGRGSIFQGHFKAVYIKTIRQFINTICYVFTNPVELIEKDWKEVGTKDSQKAIKFLESYKWSNYLDCIGKKNFPSVTNRKPIFEVFGGVENLKRAVENWILYKVEFKNAWEKNKDLFLALE